MIKQELHKLAAFSLLTTASLCCTHTQTHTCSFDVATGSVLVVSKTPWAPFIWVRERLCQDSSFSKRAFKWIGLDPYKFTMNYSVSVSLLCNWTTHCWGWAVLIISSLSFTCTRPVCVCVEAQVPVYVIHNGETSSLSIVNPKLYIVP